MVKSVPDRNYTYQIEIYAQAYLRQVKINKIHHVAIICSNYEASKKFYVDILKFTVIEETYRRDRDSYKLDLKVSDRDTLELFSFPSPPLRPSKPEACGLRHLAFEVDNIAENVDYLISQRVNVEPIRVDLITGKKFTFFKDPDDLPLEIYEM
jgi:glyoxylase I family protein